MKHVSFPPFPPSQPQRHRALDRAVHKLRREGFRSRLTTNCDLCGPKLWLNVSNIERLEILPDGEGWVAELGFKKHCGQAGVILRVPARGCYPSRRQAEVEARNTLRRLMHRKTKS